MNRNSGFTRQNFAKKISGGFTLIELLVVIAVIGILAAVVLASLNSARVKARNARRNSDIKQLVNAFNLGINGSNGLPNSGTGTGDWHCVSATCYDGWSAIYLQDATVDAFIAPYLPTKPSDPVGGSRGYGGYLYHYDTSRTMLDGTVLSGSMLTWMQEPPNAAGICGSGKVYSTTSNRVQCVMIIGQ